jgi:hypothetical protein
MNGITEVVKDRPAALPMLAMTPSFCIVRVRAPSGAPPSESIAPCHMAGSSGRSPTTSVVASTTSAAPRPSK